MALVGRQLHEALVGDAGQDGVALRGHEGRGGAVHGHEVGGGELLHEAVGLGVQVQHYGEALLLRGRVGQQVGRVVARHLDVAHSPGGRAVESVRDQGGDGPGQPAAVVVGHGHDHHHQAVLIRRLQTHPRPAAEQHRPDVEGAPSAVRGQVGQVVPHHHADPLREQLLRHLRHAYPPAGGRDPPRVFIGSEDADLAVFTVKSF
mmetsp:Transcript_12372/g.17004  ORF Transcript_12372/g.17004 Transcript_12372/m.17004 type:complete len:204 (-) Transcript_12372:367-978(-)